jgi:hypothetical protein
MNKTCQHAHIQKRAAIIGLAFLALAIALATAPVSALWLLDDDQMRIRHGDVFRNRWTFTIRAVYVPDLFTNGATEHDIIAKTNRVAAVGANTVAFDLPGLSEDGTAMDADAAEFIRDMMSLITWRRMSAMVRVFHEDAPADMEYRMAVVDALAQEMRRDTNIVYWIDGPNAGLLARRLSAAAPRLCIAAPSGGDIIIGEEDTTGLHGEEGRLERGMLVALGEHNQPEIVVGDAPDPQGDQAHFLLNDVPVDLERYDALLAPEEDFEPWEPDNSVLSEEEREEGFIALFDGETLDGWVGVGGQLPGFQPVDGELHYVGHMPGTNDIRTTRRYSDFILRVEYAIVAGSNSGIFVRAPRTARYSKIGMEFQLMGDRGRPVTRSSTGSIYDVVAARVDAQRPYGEWNEVEITLDGAYGKAIMNGEVLWEVDFDEDPELAPRLREGFIALQTHTNEVKFRNVRLKEL